MSRFGLWALVASLATAGGIHLAVAYEHSFVGVHGMFFVLTGVIQAVGAAVVARRPHRGLIGLAALGSVALLATWLVQRTPGLAGGDAFDPLATIAAVAEVFTVVAAVCVLARPIAVSGRIPSLAALGVVAFVACGSGAFAGDGHGDHHHHEGTVVSDATSRAPRSEAGRLPPAAPASDHHRRPTADDASDVEAETVPPVEHSRATASGDDHHDDEGAAPHDH